MFTHCRLVYTGTSEQIEKFTYPRGKWQKRKYPATLFELTHEKLGTVLIDTGYSENLKKDMPYLMYQLYCLAVHPKSFVHKFRSSENRQNVSHVLISHFHPDHISDVKQYSKAQKYSSNKISALEATSAIKQYKQGFFPDFQDANCEYAFYEDMREVPLYPDIVGFEKGYDVFGDQSCIAIATPGHAVGHYSFFIRFRDNSDYVCIACDIAWHIEAIHENVLPQKITGLFTQYDEMIATIKKFQNLHKQRPAVPIVLTHCEHSHRLFEIAMKKTEGEIYEIEENVDCSSCLSAD